MLKWFFLAFLVLLYAVLNTMWIVGGDMSTDARIAVFFISQLLPASLLSFWLSAYIRRFENSSASRFRDVHVIGSGQPSRPKRLLVGNRVQPFKSNNAQTFFHDGFFYCANS